MIAIAMKIVGTAMNMSIKRIMIWSTLPPKNPAMEPIMTPKMNEKKMMQSPANREMRPP